MGPLTYQLHSDPYAFMVNTIMGQMLSNKVAGVLQERLLNVCDGNVTPAYINSLGYEKIHDIGISKQKATYIMRLTNEILSGSFDFSIIESLDDSTAVAELTQLPGIWNWSAKMYLIFVLNRMNILPYEDGAFIQSYKWLYKSNLVDKESIIKKCKKWSPYSSIAARYLYRCLDQGLTRNKFHLYK